MSNFAKKSSLRNTIENFRIFLQKFLFDGNLSIKKKFSVFATNFDFLIPLTLQPNVVDLGYFI